MFTDRQTHRQTDYCGHPFRVSGFFPSTYHQGSAQLGIVWDNTTPSTELPRDFCAGIGPRQLGFVLVGPILDDRLKEKILKSWKGALSSHFRVCLSVCLSVRLSVRPRAAGHTFWPKNLIFGLSDPWEMRKKRIFLFFEIFIFTLFIGIFRFFSLYNTSTFLVSSYRSHIFT